MYSFAGPFKTLFHLSKNFSNQTKVVNEKISKTVFVELYATCKFWTQMLKSSSTSCFDFILFEQETYIHSFVLVWISYGWHSCCWKQKQIRRSFTREFKLSVIEWYCNNDNNILQTASKFKGDRKQIRNWIAERRKY